MLNIIQIPHQSLRSEAAPITDINKKTLKFLKNLSDTLENKRNPKGVGLAAPQVDKLLRAFAVNVNDDPTAPENTSEIEVFINPIITATSKKHTLGPKRNEVLEGCLSMVGMYGPVPRWEWIEMEYEILDLSATSPKLIKKSKKFSGFKARVIQHEQDHLDGILFTDYSLEYDLPVYLEKGTKLDEIEDRSILQNY